MCLSWSIFVAVTEWLGLGNKENRDIFTIVLESKKSQVKGLTSGERPLSLSFHGKMQKGVRAHMRKSTNSKPQAINPSRRVGDPS